MMRFTRFAIAAAAVAAMASSASAGTVPATRSAQERALIEVRNEVAQQAGLAGKGAAQQSYEMERRRLDDLIARMEAGRPVSSEEVDEALDSALTAP
jgi:hypothetical protein